MNIPTVRIKSSHPDHEQGFIVINESDFDKAVHEIWVDKETEYAKLVEAERAELERVEAKRAEALKASSATKAAQPAATSAKPATLGLPPHVQPGRDDRNR
jgi:hypothetical protein